MTAALADRVLAMLPVDGSIPIGELWRQADANGLCTREVGSALAELCTARRAAVERRGGYSVVRRLPAATATTTAASMDFPLVRRASAA